MSLNRRFLLAPSLARLIEKERGSHQLIEGLLSEKADRSIYVRVGDDVGHLILAERGPNGGLEQTATLPVGHALALLEYAAKRVEYREVNLELGDLAICIHLFAAPEPINLIRLNFDQAEHAQTFEPPPWLGPEVTEAPEYQLHRIAFDGYPEVSELEITNIALNSPLDVLQGPSSADQASLITPRPPQPISQPINGEQTADTDEAIGEDADIEDDVIRELARSLRPKQR